MRAIQKTDSTPSLLETVPVAIYTRVSTTGQVGGRFDSCESQAAICREHIAKHAAEGWHEVACFTDAAYSGATLNRPGMQALKRQIELGLIRVVIIFKLERVLRSTDEWSPLRAFLQKHGCRLVSTTEDLSEDTPSGRLKNNLLVSVAEYERLNTAEKVRAKLLAQAKRGYWNCGAVPYGYDYSSKEQSLSPNPVEAPVVLRIFESVAGLVPLSAIAETLNAEGLRTRVREFRRRDGTVEKVGGRRFRMDNLAKIVGNPIYLGKVRFHGQNYPALHAALVTELLWEKANAALARPKENPSRRLRLSDRHFHLLKGVVCCAVCGRAMVPHAAGKQNAAGKNYRYYTCGQLYREREVGRCGVRHVSAMGLERVIIAFLGEIHRHDAILTAAVEASQSRRKSDRAPLQALAAEVQTELARVNQQLRNCVDAIAAGGFDALGAELRERASSLRDKKQELLVRQERARQDLLACEQDTLDAKRVAASLEKFADVFAKLEGPEQKTLVALCIERIELRQAERPAAIEAEIPADVRFFDLRLRLPFSRLVECVEQRLVIQDRDSDRGGRPLQLRLICALGQHGVATILEPFCRHLGEPWRVRHIVQAREWRHPIHQAHEWREALNRRRGMTIGSFAETLTVSRATLDFHLLLFRLAPEIQRFLDRLSDKRSNHYFGLIPMGIIARMPLAEQRAVFARLCESAKAGGIKPKINR